MNPALRKARQQFKGQKATVPTFSGDYDNTPWSLGTHFCEITKSEIRVTTRQGDADVPTHMLIVRSLAGEDEGKTDFPFAPRLDTLDGLVSAAQNIQRMLGDVIPGKTNVKGEFELNAATFLDKFEELAAKCVGERVEVKVVNQKPRADGSHLKADGTPRQNFFIQRGLGDDEVGVPTGGTSAKRLDPEDDLSMTPTPKTPKKKAAKKKAARRR